MNHRRNGSHCRLKKSSARLASTALALILALQPGALPAAGMIDGPASRAHDNPDSPAASMGEIPDGLSASDWIGIRRVHEIDSHALHYLEDGTHTARNPGQQWRSDFDGRGFLISPDHGRWSWGLELASVGGAGLGMDHATSIIAEENRLRYCWSEDVEEWFVNDRRGLEQGWTIRRRPAEDVNRLRLQLRVRGGLVPSSSSNRRGVCFRTRAGATVLNYDGLKAWDAHGRPLEVRFHVEEAGTLTISVEDSTAVYPITIDPVVQQAYLKASNAGNSDLFGHSLAVSGDTVAVGAFNEDGDASSTDGSPNDNAPEAGAVYIYVRDGGTWTQQAYLKASNAETSDNFGASVALSGDTLVVGAHQEAGDASSTAAAPNNAALAAGAAYVFVRSGTTWSQQAYLKASNAGPSDGFGGAVAVSGDTIIVSAYTEDGNGSSTAAAPNDNAPNAGAAYVFTRTGTTWSQQAYLKASNAEAGDQFGRSVAIRDDTAVVGTTREAGDASSTAAAPNNNEPNSGAAYVFVRNGATWSQQDYLKASNAELEDSFGYSVAMGADLIVVGALFENGDALSTAAVPNEGAGRAGAAYVFSRTGTTWSQAAYLKASNAELDDNFGFSVAVSGGVIAVGARTEAGDSSSTEPAPNNNAFEAGAVYVFARDGINWTQRSYLKASNAGVSDRFGSEVALWGDTLVVGALLEDGDASSTAGAPNDDGSQAGAAYVFDLDLQPEIVVEHPAGVELVSGGSQLDFGMTWVGATGAPKVITVRNTGSSTLHDLSVNLSGADVADFPVTATGLPSSLPPGASGTISLSFSPTALGSRQAFLEIASNDADENPFMVALTGEGTLPDQAYLKAFNAEGADWFGTSVAISGDTVVVGAPHEAGDASSTAATPNNDGYNTGAAYVFVKDGGAWTLQAYLKAPNAGESDAFGQSVAIFGDTIVVGAPYEFGDLTSTVASPNDNAPGAGAAYVFVRSGTSWSHEAYLKASNTEASDNFGISVGISGDTVVVGAHREDGAANSSAAAPNNAADFAGSAYVFVRSGSTWSQQSYLKASNAGAGDWFGERVAISGDTVVVGAHLEDGSDSSTTALPDDNAGNAGAAYVFVRSGTAWSQQAYLKASNADSSDQFGRAVAISGDTVVIGAEGEDGDAASTSAAPNNNLLFFTGAGYVFTRSGTTWVQEAYLKAPEVGGGDRFGSAVAIEGDLLVVGAKNDRQNGSTPPYAAGAVYTFARAGTTWNLQDYTKAFNVDENNYIPGDDNFGHSVALSGPTIVVGAVYEDGDASSSINSTNNNAEKAGAAYVFEIQPGTPQELFGDALAAASLSGDDADPLATPFPDGVPNLLKYAFNMNLAGPDSQSMTPGGSSGLPLGALVEDNNQTYWRVEFVRRKDSGLIYTPRKFTSLDLGSGEDFTATPTVIDIDDEWERVLYNEPCDPDLTPEYFSVVQVELP